MELPTPRTRSRGQTDPGTRRRGLKPDLGSGRSASALISRRQSLLRLDQVSVQPDQVRVVVQISGRQVVDVVLLEDASQESRRFDSGNSPRRADRGPARALRGPGHACSPCRALSAGSRGAPGPSGGSMMPAICRSPTRIATRFWSSTKTGSASRRAKLVQAWTHRHPALPPRVRPQPRDVRLSPIASSTRAALVPSPARASHNDALEARNATDLGWSCCGVATTSISASSFEVIQLCRRRGLRRTSRSMATYIRPIDGRRRITSA